MSEKERLEFVIKSFCRNRKSEFAKQLEVSAQAVNNWLNRGLSRDAIEKIHTRWSNLNINWLISGEGDMILSEESVNVRKIETSANNGVLVRFFSVTPTATFQEFCAGMDEEADTITLFPQPGEKLDDKSCVFEIYGESMAPQIQNHARVLCIEISPTRWHQLHDCVVVIAYSDRFVIKRIVKNRLDSENYLILASDNPDFPNQETVQVCDIRCIYKAQRIISQQIF